MPKDEWKPVSLISEKPFTKGNIEVFTRNLTESSRIASLREAAGSASVLDFGGPSGTSIPGVLATNSPISAFLYTLSRADKLSLFRYWAINEPMVGRAIELHSELPMSRVTIGPPKGPSPRQNKQITRIYESMCERLDLLGLLLEISREYWMCFHPDSRVSLEGGASKRIGDVKVGDVVLTDKGNYRKVLKKHTHVVDEELYVINSSSFTGSIKVTGDHKFITPMGEVKACDLKIGSTINSFSWIKDQESYYPRFSVIDRIDREFYNGEVHDLTVEEDHTYVVENASVHNCGDVYLWCTWSDKLLQWEEVYVLPVEFVHSIIHPFNRRKEIIFFAKPLVDTAAVRRITDRDMYLVCLVEHTLIQMGDGKQKFIEEVQIGDEVLSGEGNIRKVLDAGYRLVEEEIYKITLLNNSEPIQITGNHKIHTTRGRIPARDIVEGDLFYFRPPQQEVEVEGMTDGKAILVGWFLAEGNVRKLHENTKGEVFFSLNLDEEQDEADQIKELLEQEFPPEVYWGRRKGCNEVLNYKKILKTKIVKPILDRRKLDFPDISCAICEAPTEYLQSLVVTTGPGYLCKVCGTMRSVDGTNKSRPSLHYGDSESNCIKVYYKNEAAYNFFKQFSPINGSEHKELPKSYMLLPKSQQRLIWDAFHLGDGHHEISRGKPSEIRFGSTSPNLRDQMYLIAARLGINTRRDVRSSEQGNRGDYKGKIDEFRARTWTRERTQGEKPTYYLYSNKSTLEKQEKSKYQVDSDGNLLLLVTSVEKVFHSGPVYNICVEGDHTYHANGAAVNNSDSDIEKLYEALGDTVPPELKEALNYGEAVPLNTNWRRGSYCIHLTRNRAPNEEYGQALIQRCVDTLLRLENLKNANLQISSRNMSPKHLVTAPGIGEKQLNDLRAQIDLSMLESADYPILCVLPDSHVRMGDGTTERIDQVRVGDRVRTQQGRIQPVDYVHKNMHKGVVYEIYARGLSTPIRITGNHRFFTKRGDIPACELKTGDILFYQPYLEESDIEGVNKNRGYLLGWYAAEGCIGRDTVIFCLNPSKGYDYQAVDEIIRLLELEFPPEYRFFHGVEVSGRDAKVLNRARYREAGPQAATVTYTNRNAVKFFSEECPGKSHVKRLSEKWVVARREVQRELLSSWMKGDGAVDPGNLSCNGVSFSVDLRDQMYDIASRLGINPYPYVCMDNKVVDEVIIRGMTLEERKGHHIQFRLLIGSYDARTKLWMVDHPRQKVDISLIKEEYQRCGLVGGGRVKWTPERDQFIVKYYRLVDPKDLADCMGISARSLKVRAQRLGERRQQFRGEYGVIDTGALELKVESVKEVLYDGYVYNLDIREDHTYILENAAVHNCNFEVNWQTIGANDRLLNTESEYNLLRQDLAIGLGSTVEMLTGQTSYSGQRLTIETMNTQYLTFRDRMRRLVEEDLFRPVADAMGHYQKEYIDIWPRVEPEDIEVGDILSEEEDGQLRRKRILVNVLWNHSTLRFNRISIRDNAEVYDQLFQLYQKGSLAVRYLLDLHNIDPEENSQAMLEDIGTPRDPVFNDFIRAMYTATDVPQSMVNDTDFVDRIMKGMRLAHKPRGQGGAAGGAGGGGMGGGAGLSDLGMVGGGGIGGGPPGGLGGGPPGGEVPGGPGGVLGGPGGVGGEGSVGGGPGAQPVAPGVPAPAASRGRGSSGGRVSGVVEDMEQVVPGRLLTPEVSRAAGRAIRAMSRKIEREHGRSLSKDEVQSIIRAVEKESRKRLAEKKKNTSKSNSKVNRNGKT